ncbi:chorismate synthase [Oscillospiraceae bacterium MB08-C2-2]|nr:chorismate synthase [Oscillospiraceae bacterium MB08-C2-2]
MSSSWGKNIKLSIFGESHGNGIGVVLDGLPAGEAIDMEELAVFQARRAPRKSALSTARKESDGVKILSGFFEGHTTGTPLCGVLENTDTRSGDYKEMSALARPGHGDYTGFIRYSGYNDMRGGGHFSARLTAPLVFAGGIAKQILARRGIVIGGHIAQIHGIKDTSFDPVAVNAELLEAVTSKAFPVLDDSAGQAMEQAVKTAHSQGDSVGGIVECAAVGVPVGIGSPIFDGLENKLASIMFGVPAVKGIEFGAGFEAAQLTGSQNNDSFYMEGEQVRTKSNNHGGILGGISSGMPVVMRVAFKPTPSIAQTQQTVDFRKQEDAPLQIRGRHDPCVVLRAVPCVEACMALALLDCLLEGGVPHGFRPAARAD